MRKKFLIILIFALALLGAVGFFYWQKNSYSKEILKLEIISPASANVGEEIEYLVKVKNNGEIRLEEPNLIFEFPSNTLPSDNDFLLRRTIDHNQIGLGLYPGEEKIFKFKARLFGQEGEAKEAKAIMSYKPKNIKAKYVSKTSSVVILNSVPLTLEFDIPSIVTTETLLKFSLNYFSSIDFPISDARIKIEYPKNFSFEKSEPKEISIGEWIIPIINKGEGGRIVFYGSLGGEANQEKIFQAEFGVWFGGDYVVLKKTIKKIKISEPSIYIDQIINENKDYIASPGDLLHYNIIFRNIGDQPLQNLFLVVKLKSDVLDLSTIKSEQGEYGPGDSSIIWDGRKISFLRFLDVGEEGEVDFWIKVKDNIPPEIKNPSIESEIRIGQAKKQFITKIRPSAELEQMVFYDDEIFQSKGPVPLRTGQSSYLTIIWKLKNYNNPLKSVKVKAILSPEAKPTGQVNPQKLTFDSLTRELIWEIGDIEPRLDQEKTVQIAFQINITPNINQVGRFVNLVDEVKIVAFDEWIGKEIIIPLSSLSTAVLGEKGLVVQY